METIAFDLDGVIYPWQEVCYNEVCRDENLSISFEDFWKGYIQKRGDIFWYNITRIPIYFFKRSPYTGAVDIINRLAKKYNIVYITCRAPEVMTVTEKFMREYKLPNHKELYFTDDKSVTIRAIGGVEYLIDDRIEIVEQVKNICNTFLLDRVWNEGYNDDNVVRIYNLSELLTLL